MGILARCWKRSRKKLTEMLDQMYKVLLKAAKLKISGVLRGF